MNEGMKLLNLTSNEIRSKLIRMLRMEKMRQKRDTRKLIIMVDHGI